MHKSKKQLTVYCGWISLGISVIGYILLVISAILGRMDMYLRESMYYYALWPHINKPLFIALSAYCAISVIALISGLLMRDDKGGG